MAFIVSSGVMPILEKGIKAFTGYVTDQQDRVVDSMAKADAEKFRRVYNDRVNKDDATRKLIEKAAKKRNWKG